MGLTPAITRTESWLTLQDVEYVNLIIKSSIKQSNPVLFRKWCFSADPLYKKGFDFSMSSGHLFFCITRVHNQTLSSQNLQPKKAQVSPAPALCSTLSPDETAFNSFIFFFAWPIHTPAFCPSHPGSIHIPLFTFSTPFSKVHLHSPYPIIKTILPCRSGLLILPRHEQPAFHRKVLPLSLSHECMVLIASSMQLSLQSHKWKCFVGRCTSHISLKRKSEG